MMHADVLDFNFEGFNEGGAPHRLSLNDVVVKDVLDVVCLTEDLSASLAIWYESEHHLWRITIKHTDTHVHVHVYSACTVHVHCKCM